jgi:hypothetical protein
MKINTQEMFDALCDLVLHELSAKMMIQEYHDNRKLHPIAHFINDEREARNLPRLRFVIKPEGLVYNWNEWNSGGGCMIWSVDLLEHYSIHMTDECCFLCSVPSEKYWSIEDYEEQVQFHLAEVDMNDVSQNRDVDTLFVPWLGQEIADAVQRDINAIAATF